jgi:hypothetical protein
LIELVVADALPAVTAGGLTAGGVPPGFAVVGAVSEDEPFPQPASVAAAAAKLTIAKNVRLFFMVCFPVVAVVVL